MAARRALWIAIPAIALAILATAWLRFERPAVDEEPASVRALSTSWSYTLRNTTNHPLHEVEIVSFAPIKADLGQEVISLSVDHPFEQHQQGRAAATIQVGTLPPYGQRVIRVEAEVLLATVPTVPDRPLEAWLQPSNLVESDDSDVQALAGSLRRNDAATSARAIHDWLTGNIEYSGYDPMDRGASHALRNRRGDCTEFAALATALARAMQIPARLVTGYVRPENGPLKANEYHAWAELLIEDRWLILDAQKGVFDGPPEHYLRTTLEGPAHADGVDWHRFYTKAEGLAITMH